MMSFVYALQQEGSLFCSYHEFFIARLLFVAFLADPHVVNGKSNGVETFWFFSQDVYQNLFIS